MKNQLSVILVLAAGLTLAQGQSSFIVTLDANQEVPPATGAARGLGTLVLNADGTLKYNIDYIGLTSDFAAANLHGPAPPDATAPPIFTLTNSPYTARAGKLNGTTSALTADQKTALNGGQTYANILTTNFPDGEIRGQVTAAPIGPFSPEDWPTTKDANKKVHYVSTDQAFQPPDATWLADELQILSGGDQATGPITIGGHTGVKLTGSYFNVADLDFEEWADKDTIDILVQVYGDASLFAANGNPRTFSFLTGTLPELNFPVGGFIPVEAKNKQWNWVLFRIVNGIRPSDGTHYVGSIPAGAGAGSQAGGVNGGTIRIEAVPGIIVRLVAFGEKGAFGEPAQVNVFPSGETCDPEPNTNLAEIDLAAHTTNHVQVLNDGDQTVTFADNVGPADDKRSAVVPTGQFLNFAITDNYLGKPCNDPRAMKVCVDFYDDPAFAGADVHFGPEAYATDDKGGVAIYPADQRQTLSGSGKWIRRSWVVGAVNLEGVNAGTLTAGPRFISENGQVYVSRFAIAVFRTGTHPLAGQDPLAGCVQDPNICTGAYGNFAELDLAKGTQNGLDVGSSGGDQLMVVEEAGPANDRRQAVRPDGTPGIYLNFAITGEALGPSTQDNADLAICATYYDDPGLVGATFRPEVYQSEQSGVLGLAFTAPAIAVALEGTDQWRDAYFEIPDMKFNGVNQGPQAAARFVLSQHIYITRLRYAVIRPCGPTAGVNLLESCKPVSAPTLGIGLEALNVRLFWPTNATGFTLQTTLALVPAQWTVVTNAPTVQGDQYIYTVTAPSDGTRFFRLAK